MEHRSIECQSYTNIYIGLFLLALLNKGDQGLLLDS